MQIYIDNCLPGPLRSPWYGSSVKVNLCSWSMAPCLRTRPLCVLVPYRESQFARQLCVLVLYRRTQLGRLHSALSFTDKAEGLGCEEINPPGHLGGPLVLLNFSQQVQLLWWPLGRLQIGGSLLDLFLTDLTIHIFILTSIAFSHHPHLTSGVWSSFLILSLSASCLSLQAVRSGEPSAGLNIEHQS